MAFSYMRPIVSTQCLLKLQKEIPVSWREIQLLRGMRLTILAQCLLKLQNDLLASQRRVWLPYSLRPTIPAYNISRSRTQTPRLSTANTSLLCLAPDSTSPRSPETIHIISQAPSSPSKPMRDSTISLPPRISSSQIRCPLHLSGKHTQPSTQSRR
jgi:hypothetical protein